jgi:hypothetical protein
MGDMFLLSEPQRRGLRRFPLSHGVPRPAAAGDRLCGGCGMRWGRVRGRRTNAVHPVPPGRALCGAAPASRVGGALAVLLVVPW